MRTQHGGVHRPSLFSCAGDLVVFTCIWSVPYSLRFTGSAAVVPGPVSVLSSAAGLGRLPLQVRVWQRLASAVAARKPHRPSASRLCLDPGELNFGTVNVHFIEYFHHDLLFGFVVVPFKNVKPSQPSRPCWAGSGPAAEPARQGPFRLAARCVSFSLSSVEVLSLQIHLWPPKISEAHGFTSFQPGLSAARVACSPLGSLCCAFSLLASPTGDRSAALGFAVSPLGAASLRSSLLLCSLLRPCHAPGQRFFPSRGSVGGILTLQSPRPRPLPGLPTPLWLRPSSRSRPQAWAISFSPGLSWTCFFY